MIEISTNTPHSFSEEEKYQQVSALECQWLLFHVFPLALHVPSQWLVNWRSSYSDVHAGPFQPIQDLPHVLSSRSSPQWGPDWCISEKWCKSQPRNCGQSSARFKQCSVESAEDKVLFQKTSRLPSIAIYIISWTQFSDLLWKCNMMAPGNVIHWTHISQPQRQFGTGGGDPIALVGVCVESRMSFL